MSAFSAPSLLVRHNSASSFPGSPRAARPPGKYRNDNAPRQGPRSVRFRKQVRKTALNEIKSRYASENNKNINKLVNLLRNIRIHKNLNTISAYNVLALMWARNAVVRARQTWKNVR
jgi:hypothetical protein